MSTFSSILRSLAAKIWEALCWLGRGLARPYQQGAQGQPASSQRSFLVVFVHIFGEDLLVAIGILVCSLAGIVLAAILYGLLNDIPSPRVIVGFVGGCVFWAIMVGGFQYWFRFLGSFGSRIFAYFVSFILAVLLGVALMNWTFLDRVLGIAT